MRPFLPDPKQKQTDKLNTKSTASLKLMATRKFNAYIRKRDKGKPCISCGEYKSDIQCGHFYSAGNHNNLRFNEDNTAGQCRKCNYFLSGNLLRYRENLIARIGIERVEKLDFLSKVRTSHKDDRFLFLEIIKKY